MKTKRVRRRWFWRLCALTVVAAIGIGVGLLDLLKSSSVTALRAGFEAYHVPLTAIRLAVIGLIGLSWPALIRRAELKGHISIERSIELAALRWRVVVWLVVIELLIGQNLLWWLFEAPRGAGT